MATIDYVDFILEEPKNKNRVVLRNEADKTKAAGDEVVVLLPKKAGKLLVEEEIKAMIGSGGTTGGSVDLTKYFTKDEVNAELAKKANTADVYAKADIDAKIKTATDGIAGLESTKQNFNTAVRTTEDQTIGGTKTFSAAIICNPAPTDNAHLTNKKYVDDKVAGLLSSTDAGNTYVKKTDYDALVARVAALETKP